MGIRSYRANQQCAAQPPVRLFPTVQADPLWVILVCCGLLLGGCISPQELLDIRAADYGFQPLLLDGEGFRHVAYRKPGAAGTLHVYLDGDGSPWRNRYTVAIDPTPRRPLMLRLMAYDPHASLYLGRPCYHGQHTEPGCSPLLWTTRRYGPEVLDSLAAALANHLADHSYPELVFIGHSGGGTLAMLLAERFAQTRAVLTLAANLDIDAWTALHDYSPLSGSLNPASRAPLPARIAQLHLAGADDSNVPAALIEPVVRRQPCAEFRVLTGHDHFCCWEREWPQLLRELEAMPGCG
jgi:pimeloyl-ACP methyl ester carboxylesterase